MLQDRDQGLVSKLARNAIDSYIETQPAYLLDVRPSYVGVSNIVIGKDMDGLDNTVIFLHDASPDATAFQRYIRRHVAKMLGGDVMVEVVTEW